MENMNGDASTSQTNAKLRDSEARGNQQARPLEVSISYLGNPPYRSGICFYPSSLRLCVSSGGCLVSDNCQESGWLLKE